MGLYYISWGLGGSNGHINGIIILKVHLQRWQCIDVMLLKNSLQKVIIIAFFVGSPCIMT